MCGVHHARRTHFITSDMIFNLLCMCALAYAEACENDHAIGMCPFVREEDNEYCAKRTKWQSIANIYIFRVSQSYRLLRLMLNICVFLWTSSTSQATSYPINEHVYVYTYFVLRTWWKKNGPGNNFPFSIFHFLLCKPAHQSRFHQLKI